jgi:hypothetical protein
MKQSCGHLLIDSGSFDSLDRYVDHLIQTDGKKEKKNTSVEII